jgi:lipase maturation factor
MFLRALGLIYFSAFYSLLFQIKGLMGPNGILPAGDYLHAVSGALHGQSFWYAPTLFWLGSSDRVLMLVCWAGLLASVLLVANLWPRGMLVICFVCFLAFVSAAQDFSSYQSDGMLLEAGFISLFFAPPALRPGLGGAHPPSRASLFLLQWEWFRIYFESGVVKIASGDPSWRHLTAMDDYYQNGPLPSWIGWYVQQFPHGYHAATVLLTFAAELGLVWMLFLPRTFRIACFSILTLFQIGIILTANYAFLNYLVASLGLLLLDDGIIEAVLPGPVRTLVEARSSPALALNSWTTRWHLAIAPFQILLAAICLGTVFYVSSLELAEMFLPTLPLPQYPVRMLDPWRIANRYGLFAVMTRARYEIEFQGSYDGKNWTAYPFRYKPQDVRKAPGIYAPYQPRFDWNLWFASLGRWQDYRFVIWTEERLLQEQPDVLELFAGNPFTGMPPQQVRAVIYQYWFTDRRTKRENGTWWRRERLGEYAPPLARAADGEIMMLNVPLAQPPPP